jgi:5'-3' exonuclease
VRVHLVDGTYELFRYHFAPNNRDPDHGATRGVLGSMFDLLERGATHVGIATDHVIESFRNDLWPGYKTGDGVDARLKAQFTPFEEALEAAGFVVWAMVEYEADDALGAGAAVAAADPAVDQVVICTPDKDLAQCVVGDRVVQLDRRRDELRDEAGVHEKFGVGPASIPDYLALVGDSADGFPGISGWGAKSAATVLHRYGHIEQIPAAAGQWDVSVRGGAKLAKALHENLDEALLFRRIATVDCDAPVNESVADLRCTGPADSFAAVAEALASPGLHRRAMALADARS